MEYPKSKWVCCCFFNPFSSNWRYLSSGPAWKYPKLAATSVLSVSGFGAKSLKSVVLFIFRPTHAVWWIVNRPEKCLHLVENLKTCNLEEILRWGNEKIRNLKEKNWLTKMTLQWSILLSSNMILFWKHCDLVLVSLWLCHMTFFSHTMTFLALLQLYSHRIITLFSYYFDLLSYNFFVFL